MNNDINTRTENFEDSLSEEGRYRLLVQSIRDYAIYLLDARGIVENWNPGAERFKGYKADEIIGQHFSRFYDEEDKAANLPQRALAIAEREGVFEAEGWRVRKDGSKFWAHVVIDPIRDRQGKLVGFAKITRDLTERREAQQELEKAKEALFQSQKTEAIGQLTGGIAHDFNNLLAAVIGNLEILRKRIADPKLISHVENALEGAKRGASLTKRMLAFARQTELRATRVDVPALVHGMADLLKRNVGEENVLETYFPIGVPAVLVDATQLETALLNLVVNARDAIPQGGKITIGARLHHATADGRLKPGHYVAIQVTDNGQGMDETTLRRATEPFFSTKGIGKGTGLGLSMAYGLAAQSGGELLITSREGEGSIIELILPAAPPLNQDTNVTNAELPSTPDAKPMNILVVDDDGLVLLGTIAMLEDLGHQVTGARSGAEALEELSRDEFDIVITDQAMPKMTGLMLAGEIRTTHPKLPIIVATGYAELPDADPSISLLGKPFLQSDLSAAIHAALEKMT
ncbi:MAG: PAS domain S-box protein [Proteobacteria bacterium]|nr:PAS domain S-box protein [Pseudomonadota bacterium]